MKKILFICLVLTVFTIPVKAKNLTNLEKQRCEKLLEIAEEKQLDEVYGACGFDDETLAWYEWAPFASANGYKKALYELCSRYPQHEYAELYCQKSADLNYAPAYFKLAKYAQNKGEFNLYENYLNKVIELNDIKGRFLLKNEADFASRQAYEELAKIYYKKQDVSSLETSLQYLQVAADAGSASASHALGVILSWNTAPDQQALSEKYLWKAILQGCPAAEENLGLINYLKQGRLYQDDAYNEIEKRQFTCLPSLRTEKKLFLNKEDCDCPQVLSWYESQKEKPFIILQIVANSALLKDKNGTEYSVLKGDKIVDGYVVEDVRPTAVIVRRVNERHVLLYRDDISCADLCVDSGTISKRRVADLPPYELSFSEQECLLLAKGIENLNNPMQPFKGLPECKLQDWQRWGNLALAEKRNKHLFLLANYEKSNYIPARVTQAEILLQLSDKKYIDTVENLLDYAALSVPVDSLSTLKKEQAFCLIGKMYMEGDFEDYSKAFNWIKGGADEGYPHSVNMLGVLYAKGIGIEADNDKAMELFKIANEFSSSPFIDALENYQLVKNKGDLNALKYGDCEAIVQPKSVDLEKLLELYEG